MYCFVQIGKAGFRGYKTLNRIQSTVFERAYNSRENLLICAPTGAGKTNIAMLAVLACIKAHYQGGGDVKNINRDAFKVCLYCMKSYNQHPLVLQIIYAAPMKALCTEMARTFSQRLAPFGAKVRELTGEMQLTRREIAETQVRSSPIFPPNLDDLCSQMLIVTPEKWDVITRKSQLNDENFSKVQLLIIDEVHLLHDDRGPVIETIVARALRHAEIK